MDKNTAVGELHLDKNFGSALYDDPEHAFSVQGTRGKEEVCVAVSSRE